MSGRSRAGRLVVLGVLVGLLLAAVALGRSDPDTQPARVTIVGSDGPVVPADDVASTAWYCAAGTSSAAGDSVEAVLIANLSARAVTATITVEPGASGDSEAEQIELEAYERARIPVSDVLDTPSPGVVVEVVGGPAIVEHELRTNDDIAMSPCAEEPARAWFFASGGTAPGTAQWLELYNPFGDDAIVDISFFTDSGVQEPQSLQGFVVSRHTKVRVAVHDEVPRQERVATRVRARTGRIVAEQVRVLPGAGGRPGITMSLGAESPRRAWTVPMAEAGAGAGGVVSIANFGIAPAEVEVSVVLTGDGVLAPEPVDVPSRSVVTYDAGARVPAGTAYAVVVSVQGTATVVAEGLLAAVRPATAVGAPAAARRWALAGAPQRASSAIVAVNRTSTPVTVELRAYTAGDPNSPRSAPAIALAPGKVARFDLDEWGIDDDQVLVVSADGPIVVGRETYAGGVSLALGVPYGD